MILSLKRSRRLLRSTVAVVAGVVALATCGDPVAPTPLASDYVLKAVRDVPLPTTGMQNEFSSILIQGGGLHFDSRDSASFSLSDSIIYGDNIATSGFPDQKRNFTVRTQYSRSGSQIVLHWSEFTADTGVINGDTLRLRWHDPNSRSDGTTELLYTLLRSPE